MEPVADAVLGVFRDYGWPAIQAAVHSPGYPTDPAVTWPRRFAAWRAGPEEITRLEAVAAMASRAPDAGTIAVLLDRLERDPSNRVRQEAAQALGPVAAQHGFEGAQVLAMR